MGARRSRVRAAYGLPARRLRTFAPSCAKIECVRSKNARSWRCRAPLPRTALLSAIACASASCGLSLSGTEETFATGTRDAGSAIDAAGIGTTLDAAGLDATLDAALDAQGGALDDGSAGPADATPADAPSPSDASAPCDSSPTSCGAPGACASCAASAQGQVCIVVDNAQTCGCGGPGNPGDCPVGMACRSMQCETSCDGQHPLQRRLLLVAATNWGVRPGLAPAARAMCGERLPVT